MTLYKHPVLGEIFLQENYRDYGPAIRSSSGRTIPEAMACPPVNWVLSECVKWIESEIIHKRDPAIILSREYNYMCRVAVDLMSKWDFEKHCPREALV